MLPVYIKMNAEKTTLTPIITVNRPTDILNWLKIPNLYILVDNMIDPPFPPSSLIMWRHRVPYRNPIYISIQKLADEYQLMNTEMTYDDEITSDHLQISPQTLILNPNHTDAIYNAKYYALREIFGSINEYGLREGEHKQALDKKFHTELHASDDNELIYNHWLKYFHVRLLCVDFATKQQLLVNCGKLLQQYSDQFVDDEKLRKYLVVSEHFINDINFENWDDKDDQYL